MTGAIIGFMRPKVYKRYHNTGVYAAWLAMRRRDDFDRAWADDFEKFLRDMGDRPAGTTLARRQKKLPFGPGNCVWKRAKPKKLGPPFKRKPKRSLDTIVTYQGQARPLRDWCQLLGISEAAMRQRLSQHLSVTNLLRPPRQKNTTPAPGA